MIAIEENNLIITFTTNKKKRMGHSRHSYIANAFVDRIRQKRIRVNIILLHLLRRMKGFKSGLL